MGTETPSTWTSHGYRDGFERDGYQWRGNREGTKLLDGILRSEAGGRTTPPRARQALNSKLNWMPGSDELPRLPPSPKTRERTQK